MSSDSGSLSEKTESSSSSQNVKSDTVKPTHAGEICQVKSLFKGEASCPCCITWSVSAQIKTHKTTDTETGGYAILARKTEGHGDFGREEKLHSIVIQSTAIREILGVILKGYPGLSPELEGLTIEAPFAPFYHHWADLAKAYNASTGEEHRHLGLLVDLLDSELSFARSTVKDLLKNGVILHKYLWAIFQPGDQILATLNGQDAILLLEDAVEYDDKKTERGLALMCKQVDFDGNSTGYVTTRIPIAEFKGTISLKDLPALPLKMRADEEALKTRILARGRKFAELRVGKYQTYDGKSLIHDQSSGNVNEAQIKGRVMVDPFAFFQFNRAQGISIRPFDAPDPVNVHVHRHRPGPPGRPLHMPPPPPPPGYGHRGPPPMMRPPPHNTVPERKLRPHEKEQVSLTDDQLLICVPFARGYSFKNKEWVLFNIEHLTPIEWTAGLFENLVLPAAEKDLLLALATSHSKGPSTFDDFVIGKGKGMVVLLDGPPGVGKTLTAESVAETMKAPLYTMSAGELGTSADGVEEKLADVLEMATMWNAILLIDEADIFMEQRSPHDLQRNEMVSIFLRHLEYYQGIMILTTNRVETMDLAFDSRVDIRLHYPALNKVSRKQIWVNFINRIHEREIFKGEEMDALAGLELNGRQIKSVVKTACLLASGKEEKLGFDHVRIVVGITRGVKLEVGYEDMAC